MLAIIAVFGRFCLNNQIFQQSCYENAVGLQQTRLQRTSVPGVSELGLTLKGIHYHLSARCILDLSIVAAFNFKESRLL